MNRRYCAALIMVFMLAGSAMAANYVFERSVIKGVGYRSHELVSQTAEGYNGQKIVKSVSGCGNIYERTEFELNVRLDSINYTQEADFEYFPVSYQTGTYDQKWQDKLCVANYDAGAVVTEQYTHAESLMKNTHISTVGNSTSGGIEANIDSDVIGVAHIGWVSKEKGTKRYFDVGRRVEDSTGVFSIEKYIQLMKNDTNSATRVDWLPCI
ncbi:MAG: hypothetical protein ACXQT4_04810 [Methanotrichaceae archaeon]